MKYMYTLKMKFMTDGDYGWDTVVPIGFNFDDFLTFRFEKTFFSYEKLKEWADKNIPILKEQFYSHDDYFKERILSYFDELLKAIYNNVEYDMNFEANDEEDIHLTKQVKGRPICIHIDSEMENKLKKLGISVTREEDILNFLNSI